MSRGKSLILAAAFITLATVWMRAQTGRTGQVGISSPVDGADVSKTIAITPRATGDVAGISFHLDGNYETANPPDMWNRNTRSRGGAHTGSVQGFSASDQLLDSDRSTLTVARATRPSYSTASPERTAPMKANDFLNTLGASTHLTQGAESVSQIESALSYAGIRNERDDGTNDKTTLKGFCRIHAATGAMIDLVAIRSYPVRTAPYDTLAACGAIDQIEGANEPNNFPFTYNGENCGGRSSTWAGCAAFQRDLYAAVKADPNLAGVRVLDLTEPGAETDNQGLQFLTIPSGMRTIQPAGTAYADIANLHNYVEGNKSCGYLNDNQAWGAEDPGSQPGVGCWDGMTGEYLHETWAKHFAALPLSNGPGVPKETTETGWQTGSSYPRYITQDQQGKLLVNLYLSAAARGWLRTYIYQLIDDGQGTWGIFIKSGSGAMPKLAGAYIHNLTTILNDTSSKFTPIPVAYSVAGKTSTIHDLLLQKSDGMYELAVWGDRPVSGTVTAVTVNLPISYPTVRVYDVTRGTTPIDRLIKASSVPLTITDHAFIVEFGG